MSSNISIAMATYNGAPYLLEQLESLKAQSLLPLELVITDDCSSDATAAIVAAYAERAPFPVRFFQNENRLGYAENFFRALSLCRGEFVAFCDQDDVWLPEKLERVSAALSVSGCDVVVHVAAVVDAALVPNGLRTPPTRRRAVVGPGGFDPWLIVPGMAMTAKRELFDVVAAGHRPNTRIGEAVVSMKHDEWLYFIGTAFGSILLLPDVLVKYRQHGKNVAGPSAAISGLATLGFARTAGQALYDSLARRAASYADFLLALPIARGIHAARRDESVAFYARVAHRLAVRSALYRGDADFRGRFANLAQLISDGAYRRDTPGSLSYRSLAKDSLRVAGILAAR
jgi:glycosyltransferase involved in cell wall biosynthesis